MLAHLRRTPFACCELAPTRLGQDGPPSTCWRAGSSAWRITKPARKRPKPARASDPHGSPNRSVEHFTLSCNCLSPFPDTRFISEPPIRGPKSAPAPYRHAVIPDLSRRWGVRVSPLSARGEGLCRAQPRFLQRPGKQAEGIQIQLGRFSYPRSTFDFPYPTKGPAQPAPWGRRFRLLEIPIQDSTT